MLHAASQQHLLAGAAMAGQRWNGTCLSLCHSAVSLPVGEYTFAFSTSDSQHLIVKF
jgi:hypothetical protein